MDYDIHEIQHRLSKLEAFQREHGHRLKWQESWAKSENEKHEANISDLTKEIDNHKVILNVIVDKIDALPFKKQIEKLELKCQANDVTKENLDDVNSKLETYFHLIQNKAKEWESTAQELKNLELCVKVMTKRIEKEIDSLVSSISKVKSELISSLKNNNNCSLTNPIQKCTQQSNTEFSENIKISNNESTSKNVNNAFDDNSWNGVNANLIGKEICVSDKKAQLIDVLRDKDASLDSRTMTEKNKEQSDSDGISVVSDTDFIVDDLIDDAVASLSKNAKHSGVDEKEIDTTATSCESKEISKENSADPVEEDGIKDTDKSTDLEMDEKDGSSEPVQSKITTTTSPITSSKTAQSSTINSIPKTKIKYGNSNISKNILNSPNVKTFYCDKAGSVCVNTSKGKQKKLTDKPSPSTNKSITSTPTPPLSTAKSPPSSTLPQMPLISTPEVLGNTPSPPPLPHQGAISPFVPGSGHQLSFQQQVQMYSQLIQAQMYGQQNMIPAAYPRPTLMARPVIGSYPHNHLNPTLVGFNSQGSVHSSIPQGPAQIYPNLYTGVPLPPYQYPHGHYPQGVSPLNPALLYPGHTAQYGGADQMEQHGEDDIIIATVPSTFKDPGSGTDTQLVESIKVQMPIYYKDEKENLVPTNVTETRLDDKITRISITVSRFYEKEVLSKLNMMNMVCPTTCLVTEKDNQLMDVSFTGTSTKIRQVFLTFHSSIVEEYNRS